MESNGGSNNLQCRYAEAISEALALSPKIKKLEESIAEIHHLVPSLAESLKAMREEYAEMHMLFNPDKPEAIGRWADVDEYEEGVGLSNSENLANTQIRSLEKQLQHPRLQMDRILNELREIILTCISQNVGLVRDFSIEAQLGLTAHSGLAKEFQSASSAVSTDQKTKTKKKPGPKGQRQSTVTRRAFIKTLHNQKVKGEEACKRLTSNKIPIPSERRSIIYKDDWTKWFKHEPASFYKQWSADLKRK